MVNYLSGQTGQYFILTLNDDEFDTGYRYIQILIKHFVICQCYNGFYFIFVTLKVHSSKKVMYN